ncbi:MAG: hypothetical protein COB04_18780 [Gammaproteobacteria bacterium]|nr:MAG: hypothetical protein COB04_18780 [Gammaproteobacteria bacterium]
MLGALTSLTGGGGLSGSSAATATLGDTGSGGLSFGSYGNLPRPFREERSEFNLYDYASPRASASMALPLMLLVGAIVVYKMVK